MKIMARESEKFQHEMIEFPEEKIDDVLCHTHPNLGCELPAVNRRVQKSDPRNFHNLWQRCYFLKNRSLQIVVDKMTLEREKQAIRQRIRVWQQATSNTIIRL
mmetsp:Transcript_23761/g.46533  ORF Transcript_23761/g.46533 Transcript_23761/m.46533 type:complete len:103 (-) Transcript_23761:225-533(-)